MRELKLFICLLAAGALVALFSVPALAFELKKDVEVITPSRAGGDGDHSARMISDIIRTEKLADADFLITSKPGGFGAEALLYAFNKAGDDHTLVAVSIGQIIRSHVLGWDVKGEDLTPIAIVADAPLLLCALAGRFKDAREAIEAGKSGALTCGGARRSGSDHLGLLLLNRYGRTHYKYVPFGTSGDALSALLGRRVDVGIFDPGECLDQIRAGAVVPLASFSAKRAAGDVFGKAPTFTELGFPDVLAAETRLVFGPPGMSAGAVAWYESLLHKVADAPRWRADYIEPGNLTPVFMNARQTRARLDALVRKRVPLFKRAG